jgi:hypothetical protein
MTVRKGEAFRLPPTFGRITLPAGLAARLDTPPDDRKEPTVTTLAEATEALGLPAPSADRPEPTAKACTRCNKTDVEFGMGGRDSICKGCRKQIMADARARRSGSSGSVNETPIATAAAVDGPLVDVTAETFATGSEADPGDETTELDAKPTELVVGTPVISPAAPVIADEAPVISQPDPSRTSEPNGDAALSTDHPLPVADLRAERERLTAYLQDLDRRIEEAVVFEQLAGKTPDELRQMLDDAQRQARLCQLALQGVA